MAKRKVGETDNEVAPEEPRRSSRRKPNSQQDEAQVEDTKIATKPKSKATKKKQTPKIGTTEEVESSRHSTPACSSAKPTKSAGSNTTNPSSTELPARQYWLMKAEPESRLEKGHDIKFSIDDLAAKTEPEPWDGIRAYPARNNLRAMKKGDLAFFYHSSCKVPAIVGIMEIVQEHTPDLSAHNPKAPYYDPKSSPDDPKWSVVHVEFRQKLKTPITLQEIKAWFNEKGHPLENMQMLKLARLSVSKISEGEWRFLVGEMEKNGDVVSVV
ncbi:thymocyte nuclear 1 protein [Rutstroemia sp. NJR-2017a WRK4]|nr:thymocyte nuclear 1 protein [Rutstroemia sp. NJR-2017a WRK4]